MLIDSQIKENANGSETDTDEAAAERKNLLLHQTLVKSDFSASTLCGSATSWGPDFFSNTENQLCQMAMKVGPSLLGRGNGKVF